MLIVLFNPQKIRLLNACSMAIIISFLLCAEVTHAFDGTGYSFTTSAFADCVIETVEPGAEVSTCCTPTPYILVNSTNSALSGDSQQTSCSNVNPDCYFDFYFADNSIVNNEGYDLVHSKI